MTRRGKDIAILLSARRTSVNRIGRVSHEKDRSGSGVVAFGFGAAADEPKTEEVKKKALDKALETFTGT